MSALPETEAQFRKIYRQMFGKNPSRNVLLTYREATMPPRKSRKKPEALVTVTKKYEWDMGHRIPNHQGKCARLHGHRYVAEIDITGPVVSIPGASDEGMVIDFYALKQVLDVNIGAWDHRCMLHEDDQMFVGYGGGGGYETDERLGVFRVRYIPTAENIAADVIKLLNAGLPDRVRCTRVRIYETPNGWAEVRA